jgi:hypothetical protein
MPKFKPREIQSKKQWKNTCRHREFFEESMNLTEQKVWRNEVKRSS